VILRTETPLIYLILVLGFDITMKIMEASVESIEFRSASLPTTLREVFLPVRSFWKLFKNQESRQALKTLK
jgi:hypothetical protein